MKKDNKHTLAAGFDAMKRLIELDFKSEDFGFAEEDLEEVGFLPGEPVLFDQDGDPTSAYQMYQDYLYSIDKDAQKMEEEFNLLLDGDIESAEYFRSLMEESRIINDNILKVIIRIKSKAFARSIRKYISDCSAGTFWIQKAPVGKRQFEPEYKHFQVVWINQYSVGGDSYEGTISIPIKKNKFLIIPYSI